MRLDHTTMILWWTFFRWKLQHSQKTSQEALSTLLSHMDKLVFKFFAICFIKMWVFHYKHMGTMFKRSNYTQNAPQNEGDCEYRISSINVNVSERVQVISKHQERTQSVPSGLQKLYLFWEIVYQWLRVVQQRAVGVMKYHVRHFVFDKFSPRGVPFYSAPPRLSTSSSGYDGRHRAA